MPVTRFGPAGRVIRRPLGRAIRITKRPAAPVRVLLAIHYDTVFAADHPFQTVTRLDANTLRGPGVGVTWSAPWGITLRGSVAWPTANAPVSDGAGTGPRVLVQVNKAF